MSSWRDYEIIQSSTSNRVYKISERLDNGCSTGAFGCSCPGWKNHGNCKHLKSRKLVSCRSDLISDLLSPLKPTPAPAKPSGADIRREKIFNTVDDLCAKFLYYDRKDDEELGVDQIEECIGDGEILIGEIVKKFRECLESAISARVE